MTAEESRTDKGINNKVWQPYTNIFVFYLLYGAAIITEKQVLRQGYLGLDLPFKLDVIPMIAGLIAGSIFILLLSLLFRKQANLILLILITAFFFGSIFINYYFSRFYYPPFATLPIGDLDALGDQAWSNTYPYKMYALAYEEYYLSTIRINPKIEDISELDRLERFGITLQYDNNVPAAISLEQIGRLENNLDNNFRSLPFGANTIRLYNINQGEEIIITRYEDLLLFIPLTGLSE